MIKGVKNMQEYIKLDIKDMATQIKDYEKRAKNCEKKGDKINYQFLLGKAEMLRKILEDKNIDIYDYIEYN